MSNQSALLLLGAVAVGLFGWQVGRLIEYGLERLSLRAYRLAVAALVVASSTFACWLWAENLIDAGLSTGEAVLAGSVLLTVLAFVYVFPIFRKLS